MGIINAKNPVRGTHSVAALFRDRSSAEAARLEIVATGVSAEAVKITDSDGTETGRDATKDDVSRRALIVTAHVAEDDAAKVRDILARNGSLQEV